MTKEETYLFIHCQRISAGCEHTAMIIENDVAINLGNELPHNAEAFRQIPSRFGIASEQVKALFAQAVV